MAVINGCLQAAFNDQQEVRSKKEAEPLLSGRHFSGCVFLFYFLLLLFLLLPSVHLNHVMMTGKRKADCFVHVSTEKSAKHSTHIHNTRRGRHMQRCLKLVKTQLRCRHPASAEKTEIDLPPHVHFVFSNCEKRRKRVKWKTSRLFMILLNQKRCPAVVSRSTTVIDSTTRQAFAGTTGCFVDATKQAPDQWSQ